MEHCNIKTMYGKDGDDPEMDTIVMSLMEAEDGQNHNK